MNKTQNNTQIKCLITDFDETFFDTSLTRNLRKEKDKDWNKIYGLIPQFKMYDGWKEVLNYLKENNIMLAVVSGAKTELLKKTFAHFGIEPDAVVGFQWCYRKPNAKLLHMALEKLGLDPSEAIVTGNSTKDELQAQRAGVRFVAAAWDSLYKEELAQRCLMAQKPQDLIKILEESQVSA